MQTPPVLTLRQSLIQSETTSGGDQFDKPFQCQVLSEGKPKMEPAKRRIGLVAGWGEFPVQVATSLKQHGYEIFCLAIKDHASPSLANICDDYRLFGIGKMGAQARYLRRAGVTQATMAGKIFKTSVIRPFHFLRHLPDLLTVRYFYESFVTGTKDCCDDTLLSTATQLFASHGIDFVPATDFAPDLLVRPGVLTRSKPSSGQLKDIVFGWKIAKEMGKLDIGQSVAVKHQSVMAVEAIEGTDQCIRRAGELCQSGFVVVKVAKPQQDMRFDVPTIGKGTIETLHRAGGKVLAIEASKTIILNENETIRLADRLGICIASYHQRDLINSEE